METRKVTAAKGCGELGMAPASGRLATSIISSARSIAESTRALPPNADALQRPGDNCASGKLSMKDMLIPVRCKRLYKKQAEQFKLLSFSICLATFNRQRTPEMSRALRPLMIRGSCLRVGSIPWLEDLCPLIRQGWSKSRYSQDFIDRRGLLLRVTRVIRRVDVCKNPRPGTVELHNGLTLRPSEVAHSGRPETERAGGHLAGR